MSIGSQIAKRRKELGMTQQELAESLDVSFQAVSAWERDEYLPETERLKPLAMSLSTTVSWLMEETNAPEPHWELHDALYSLENMKKKVRFTAQAKNMSQTLKALKQMEQYHEGQTRNGKDKIPYIHHPLMMACHALAMNLDDDDLIAPLMMACHALAMNLDDDDLIAAILLHDVVEDCGAKVEDLDVSETVRKAVSLVSFHEIEGMTKAEAKAQYFARIRENPIAAMVKLIDRCNNVSTMAMAFSKDRMIRYIDETEQYILPMLDHVKHTWEEYYDAVFLLNYQIRSLLETQKRLL